MTTSPPKYKETVCQELEITGMLADLTSDNPTERDSAVLEDGQEIRYNYSFLSRAQREKLNAKLFLMNEEDERWIDNILRRKPNGTAYLSSLKSFSADRKKKLYIRAMPSEIQNSGGTPTTKKMFADEVLELIPIAMRQQNTPIHASDDRLQKYRQKWKCTHKHLYNTIDMKEFKEVLEEFDINKEEITKFFVTVDYVRKIIETLDKSICKSPKDERYKYYQLLELDFNDSVSLHDYWQITDSHGLPRFNNFLMDPLENNFPVWNARMFLIAGWIQQFFDLEMRQLRTFLATELVSRCPEESRDELNINSFKRSIVLGESEESRGMPIEKKKNQLIIETKNLTKNKNYASEKETKTKMEKGFPKAKITSSSISTSENSSEEKVGEKKARDMKIESKCCQKCLRTSEMCNEAKKELEATQNKLAKLEKKAENFDELEKKIKEQDKEIDELKTANSQVVKDKDLEIEQLKRQVQEMEKMKSRLAQYESTGAKMKETDKKVTRDRLQEKVAQLEAQLKSKEHNSQMSQLEREITEKDETIALLQETNMRMTVRNEEQAKNIQNLLDRLTMANFNHTQ